MKCYEISHFYVIYESNKQIIEHKENQPLIKIKADTRSEVSTFVRNVDSELHEKNINPNDIIQFSFIEI